MDDPTFEAQSVPPKVREQAEKLGTWGKIKRDQQYQGPERARPEVMLHSHNEQWNRIRLLFSENDKMQRRISRIKLRNSIIVAVVTGFTARAPEIITFLWRLFR